MIVEMSQVIVLGPKRLLSHVIEDVQALGSLHIDHIESEDVPEAVSRVQLGEAESAQLQAIERAINRIDGLLTLLPSSPAFPGGGTIDPGATADAVDASTAEIERRVRSIARMLNSRDSFRMKYFQTRPDSRKPCSSTMVFPDPCKE